MFDDLPLAIARGTVIDGTTRFYATLWDTDTITICAYALRPGLDGSQGWHWTKPEVDGLVVAHASRAAWNRGAPTPLPSLLSEDEEHVDLATLMRPEAIEALGQVLGRGARSRGVPSITLTTRSTP